MIHIVHRVGGVVLQNVKDVLGQALTASLTLLVDPSANGNAPAGNEGTSQTFDFTERHEPR